MGRLTDKIIDSTPGARYVGQFPFVHVGAPGWSQTTSTAGVVAPCNRRWNTRGASLGSCAGLWRCLNSGRPSLRAHDVGASRVRMVGVAEAAHPAAGLRADEPSLSSLWLPPPGRERTDYRARDQTNRLERCAGNVQQSERGTVTP